MADAREIVHRSFHDRIPWEWSDPWARITASLAVPAVGLLLAEIWWDVPRTWLWAAFGFVFAAGFHRNALYLRRTGKQPELRAMYRGLSIVWAGIALVCLIVSLGSLLGM